MLDAASQQKDVPQAAMWNRHPILWQQYFVFFLALLLGAQVGAGATQTAVALGSPTAPPAFDVTDAGPSTPLTPYLSYLRDPSRELTAVDAAAAASAARFTPFGDAIPNLGFTTDAVWVRLALSNRSAKAIPLVLHLDSPGVSFIDLYIGAPAPGQAPSFATGTRLPYSTRPLPGRAFAFPISVPPEASTEYYLRLNTFQPLNLALTLWQPDAFSAATSSDEIVWGIILGMLLLMTGYNLLLYIVLRDHNYLVLVIFGLMVAASMAFSGGIASRWAPPEIVDWWPTLLIFNTALVIAAFAMLSISFLEMRTRMRTSWRLLIGALVVVAAGSVLALLGLWNVAIILIISAMPLILIVVFAATIVSVRRGWRLGLFLLLGQAVPIAAGLVQSLSLFGLGPKAPLLPLLVPVNSLLLLLLMSLALADRVNLLRREANQANAALQASEQRLRTYLDALPFNIQVHDAQLKPLFVNAAIRKVNLALREGWFDEQYDVWVEEFPVRISGTDQPYPTEQLPLIRAAGGETAHADDVDVVLPTGPVAIESWAVPLYDEAGAISAIVTAFQDISQRRATEQELASYRGRLEQRVAQRTAELAALNANLSARVTELTAINEVSRRVARIGDLQATLEEVAHILAESFEVASASISLFDANQQHLEVIVLADRSDGSLLPFTGQSVAYATSVGYASHAQSAAIFASPTDLVGMPVEAREELARRGIHQVLLAPLFARDASIGVLALLANDPQRTFSADEVRVVQTIAGQVAAAIDTVRLIEEVRRQRDVAEALRQTATALSRDLDQQNVIGSILEQLDQVFACEGAAVALVQGPDLVTVAAKGLSAACVGYRAPLDGASAALTVLRSRKPLLVQDTRTSGERDCGFDTEPICSWLGAPLIIGDNAIGVLSLDSIVANNFAALQADLLTTFANQAAIAVTNARLYDQAQALAVAGERDRLARDLHDAVTQTIFSASLIAASLPSRLPAVAPQVQSEIEALQMLTRGALAEMRTLLLELRPERLVDVPLDVLLTQLAQAFTGRNGIPAEVDANSDPSFAPPYAVKLAFYRVAQEALNNVSKHAKAAHVTLRYSARPGSMRLAVIDDGQGFALQPVQAEKLGLTIMQERAAAVGAQITIDSEPGLGTHVFMVWKNENNSQTA